MKLTTKGRYAVTAMLDLALHTAITLCLWRKFPSGRIYHYRI